VTKSIDGVTSLDLQIHCHDTKESNVCVPQRENYQKTYTVNIHNACSFFCSLLTEHEQHTQDVVMDKNLNVEVIITKLHCDFPQKVRLTCAQQS